MSTQNRKRKAWTLEEKYRIIKFYEENCREHGIKSKTIEKYQIPRISTLDSFLQKKAEIISAYESNIKSTRKRLKQSQHPEVDKKLYDWFLTMRANKVELSGDLILQKAKEIATSLEIADFAGSHGFLDGFKSRHNIKFLKLHGQGGSVDENVVSDWTEKLPEILNEFSPEDVFNWDETGLFFTQTRNSSLVTHAESENRNLRGRNSTKQRITVLVGSSMTGEKMPLVVIGKSEKPRAFKNVKTLPVEYYSQKKAWMDSSIFEKLLVKFDRQMSAQNRNVVLFLDNCSAHPKIRLKNVTLKFFPPNVTSRCQPMDMGIIHSLKCHYKNEVQKRRIQALNCDADAPHVNLLEALYILKKSWENNVSRRTIQNCFRKAGFNVSLEVEEIEEGPSSETESESFEDDAISTCAPLEIVTSSDQEDAEGFLVEGQDDDYCEIYVPSAREAHDALRTARSFFLAEGNANESHKVDELMAELNKLAINKLKQTSIISFFGSQTD